MNEFRLICIWRREQGHYEYDNDGRWVSECGKIEFLLNDGGLPSEHKMQYCCGCGKILEEQDSFIDKDGKRVLIVKPKSGITEEMLAAFPKILLLGN